LSTLPDRELHLRLSGALWQALRERSTRTGESLHEIIRTALSGAFDIEHHTLFQVPTSVALVQGVYQGCVRVGTIKQHGDFGIGTFDGLDGEGILLDGRCWQVRSDGSVREVPDEILAPFWVATRFHADQKQTLANVSDWRSFCLRLDAFRPSDNVFVAIRIKGTFDTIKTRAACKAESGTGLVAATHHQAEFEFQRISGVLVGFWTPKFASSINIAGYHFHFLADDFSHGGHVLELSSQYLKIELHEASDIHLALPENHAYLVADLSQDPTAALEIAETNHAK